MLWKPRKGKNVKNLIRKSWNDRGLGQIFDSSLPAPYSQKLVIRKSASTHLEFKPIEIPEPFYEKPVLLGQMTPARKLGRRIASGTAVFQDVVD